MIDEAYSWCCHKTMHVFSSPPSSDRDLRFRVHSEAGIGILVRFSFALFYSDAGTASHGRRTPRDSDQWLHACRGM